MKTPNKTNEVTEVYFLIYHNIKKKYYSRSNRTQEGWEWSDWPFATLWKGEQGRSPCYSKLQALKRDNCFDDICVKKFRAYEIKDD